MPVYEYRCSGCSRKFQALVGMVAGADEVACPHCGSKEALKLVSRFARYRSEDDRIDALADQVELMGEPDSAAEMRRVARELGKAMDEDLSDEMEEMLEGDLGEEPGER
jgi:putative FmdB family regulatory protein